MAGYTETYINNDMSKLNTVLQTLVTNGIVGAVDYDDSGTYAVFTLYADAEKTTEVFRITQSAAERSYTKFTFTATASDESTLQTTASVNGSGERVEGYEFKYGYSCENGVLFSINGCRTNGSLSVPYICLLITKNQDGNPVFVWTNNTETSMSGYQIDTNMNTEYSVAPTDIAPLSAFVRSALQERKQTVLSPFFTCSATGETSYTPNAGRILAGNMSNFIYNAQAHEVTFMNATWLTNGYWMLKV